MQEEIKKLLDRACEAYDKGDPFLSDEVFDKLLNLQRKYLQDLRSGKLDNEIESYRNDG